MTTTDQLDRLGAADPITTEWLERRVSYAARDAERDRIATSVRGRVDSRRRAPSRGYGARFGGRRLMFVGAAAGVATVLVIIVGIVGRPDSPTGPSLATAADVLHATAVAARADDRTITGDERLYTALVTASFDDQAPNDLLYAERWTATSGGGVRAHREYASDTDGRPVGAPRAPTRQVPFTDGDIGVGENVVGGAQTRAALDAIPTDAEGLGAYLTESAAVPSEYGVPKNEETVATGLISAPLASPALRGAAFDFLAGRTGVTLRGTTTDALGRSGMLLAFTPPEGGVYIQRADTELIVDPSTGRLLQMRAGFKPDDPGEQGSGATFTLIGPLVAPAEGVLPDGVSVDFPFVTPSTSGASTTP